MRILAFLMVVIGLHSCQLVESSDLDVSYIHFKRPILNTAIGEGVNSHKIQDLWISMDSDDLGVYPINRTVPFLPENDPARIFIFPGVKNNGFQTQSVIYPFYEVVEMDRSFVPEQVDTMTLNFNYTDIAKFSFIEEFEGNHIFTQNEDDDVELNFTIEQEGANKFGVMSMSEDHPEVGISNALNYNDIPLDSRPVYLELEYKNDVHFEIGIIGVSSGGQEFTNVKIILNPTDEWNKIYIDFTDDVNLSQLSAYRIVFASVYEESVGGTQKVYLDNVKLVHF